MELISTILLLKEGWKLLSTTKCFQNLTEEDGGGEKESMNTHSIPISCYTGTEI